jgi:hypothetical protein
MGMFALLLLLCPQGGTLALVGVYPSLSQTAGQRYKKRRYEVFFIEESERAGR